jgi:hypothetical protein
VTNDQQRQHHRRLASGRRRRCASPHRNPAPTVSPCLKENCTDAPDLSPWSHTIGPQACRAYELALAIRRQLGLPYRHATKALGTPPREIEDAIAEAFTAERQHIRRLAINEAAKYPFDEAWSACLRCACRVRRPVER